MLTPFVALVQASDKTLRFLPVAAENIEQATLVTGHLCVKAEQSDAVILTIFDEQDVANAQRLIEETKQAIAKAG